MNKNTLRKISKENLNDLSWHVVPELFHEYQNDNDFHELIYFGLSDLKLSTNLKIVLIDFQSSYFRKKLFNDENDKIDQLINEYKNGFLNNLGNESVQRALLRNIMKFDQLKDYDFFKNVIDTDQNGFLINEVSLFVLKQIHNSESIYENELNEVIFSKINENYKSLLLLSGNLRLVNKFTNTEIYAKMINFLKSKIDKNNYTFILESLQENISEEIFLLAVKQLILFDDPITLNHINFIVNKSEKYLINFFDQGHYNEFCFLIFNNPKLLNNNLISNINFLIDNRIKSIYLDKLLLNIPEKTFSEVNFSNFIYKRRRLNRRKLTPNSIPEIPTNETQIIPQGHIAMHIADAMYRDLDGLPLEHWHSGLYRGIRVNATQEVTMMGIQIAPTIGEAVFNGTNFNIIRNFSATNNFNNVSLTLGEMMKQLRDNFIQSFVNFKGRDVAFHGVRRRAMMTENNRDAIISTALEWFGKGLDYTFADMLDYYSGTSGAITVTDIDDSRCDGLIEYCYEANGLRVCNGMDANLSMIAESVGNVENHNDFHNHDFNQGELCPRIQAGGGPNTDTHINANDTAFVVTVVEKPIADFTFGYLLGQIPIFSVIIKSNDYSTAFLRVSVSDNVNNSFDIMTAHRGGYGKASILEGDLNLIQISTNQTQMWFWSGDTSALNQKFSKKGQTLFIRIESFDLAGNVSDILIKKITW